MQLLIVEDDNQMADTLEKGIKEAGYEPLVCSTLSAAAEQIQRKGIDLVILDLGLPDGDGSTLLDGIRSSGSKLPVIILTARDTVDAKVRGLDAGADDYLVKPFAFPELLARIRANLRHTEENDATIITIGDLIINLIERKVTRAGQPIELTTREFDLLRHLALNAGEPVSRDRLAREVWQVRSRATPLDNVIDVHVCHLRNAIDRDFDSHLIHTIRGVGFILEERS